MLNKLLCRVSQDEKEQYRKLLKTSQPILLKLKEMVEEDIAHTEEVDEKDFENPAWALQQAYRLGLRKGLTKFLEYGIIETTD